MFIQMWPRGWKEILKNENIVVAETEAHLTSHLLECISVGHITQDQKEIGFFERIDHGYKIFTLLSIGR